MTDFLIHVAIFCAIWAVSAISLNLQYGMAGLLNFGQVLFFGIGAYAVGVLSTGSGGGAPIWFPDLVGAVAAVGVGVLITLPVRRVRAEYWALATFGAAELFRLVILNEPALARGAEGIGSIASPANPQAVLLWALVLLGVAVVVSEGISRSPFGRVLRGIREDPLLVSSLGRDVYWYQVRVVGVAAALGALAGGLYAHYITYINPDILLPPETFVVWTAVILGGAGRTAGVVLGAIVVEGFSVSTRFLAQASGLELAVVAEGRIVMFALLLVVVLLVRREGVLAERPPRIVRPAAVEAAIK